MGQALPSLWPYKTSEIRSIYDDTQYFFLLHFPFRERGIISVPRLETRTSGTLLRGRGRRQREWKKEEVQPLGVRKARAQLLESHGLRKHRELSTCPCDTFLQSSILLPHSKYLLPSNLILFTHGNLQARLVMIQHYLEQKFSLECLITLHVRYVCSIYTSTHLCKKWSHQWSTRKYPYK